MQPSDDDAVVVRDEKAIVRTLQDPPQTLVRRLRRHFVSELRRQFDDARDVVHAGDANGRVHRAIMPPLGATFLRRRIAPVESAAVRPERTWETSRLLARPPAVADAQVMFDEYASDPHVARYMTWRPHGSAADTAEFLRRCERV